MSGVVGWRRRALVLIGALVLAGLLASWGIQGLGRWLVVEDPLEHARAVVVLSGDFPFRAMEAASIYKEGWAPEVWLTGPVAPVQAAAVARLGFQFDGEEVYNRRALERLGVPQGAIRLLGGGIRNTVDEVQRVAREFQQAGGDRVILVTSKAHTRRVRATWRALVSRSPQAVVRYAREDPYDAGRWWRNTRDALAVSREVFGLMNVWAGFPVQPDPQ